MPELFPEKLVTIITTDVLEQRLISVVRGRGVSGYTIVRARGAGSSGEQSAMLDIDTNIKFHVIIPAENLSALLGDLTAMIRKGHNMTVFVSDVSVLHPEKFDEPMS